MPEIDLYKFQELNTLSFTDESLLARAFVHPSYLNEHPDALPEDNQRLEFLGDAVLDFLSGELLYHRYPEAPEGTLTRLRSALVRTETLAQFAVVCHVSQALLLGRGEEESGGRSRLTNQCAAFEAFVGALYLDQGLEPVRRLVDPLFESALEDILERDLDKDPKSRLQEWSQARLGLTPFYETIESRGPDHAKEFVIAVYIGPTRYAEGVGSSKRAAAQAAARLALDTLEAHEE